MKKTFPIIKAAVEFKYRNVMSTVLVSDPRYQDLIERKEPRCKYCAGIEDPNVRISHVHTALHVANKYDLQVDDLLDFEHRHGSKVWMLLFRIPFQFTVHGYTNEIEIYVRDEESAKKSNVSKSSLIVVYSSSSSSSS